MEEKVMVILEQEEKAQVEAISNIKEEVCK